MTYDQGTEIQTYSQKPTGLRHLTLAVTFLYLSSLIYKAWVKEAVP